ncbi:Dabb family protein [Peptostreptococcus russellii]|uniref:Stress responsive A/B Barrel Domain n=1 Tax=Peptostreptococcus russellii TaxID=215200 RepID=A0A1H8IMJ1_9FIRM|nr:Dabb family protein [Peptostreptococcus russellii]SEN69197.1 Stress responsive A/B Barrel Domain [Peptostreptococcus russellii]
MKHIVLFKFERNKNYEKLSKILTGTYDKLEKECNVIKNYEFKVNCLENEANMDIILFVDLGNDYMLKDYIDHPVHQEFINAFKNEGLSSKSVIDVE